MMMMNDDDDFFVAFEMNSSIHLLTQKLPMVYTPNLELFSTLHL
jgi:hypothetical protein